MEIDNNQVFNLWDTNGRRNDIINAIEIYTRILQSLNAQYPNDNWECYPKSLKQYRFYKAAIEASPEIFQSHNSFDNFENYISNKRDDFEFKVLSLNRQLHNILDVNIEQRARHYTNSLVKLGFAHKNRILSDIGQSLLSNSVKRDSIEELLPITNTNLLIFRQLLKIKIYTKPNSDGLRYYYSPCLMSLYLLLNNESVDINSFKHQIQGITPYWHDKINLRDNSNIDLVDLIIGDTIIPQAIQNTSKILESDFYAHFKNRKSTNAINSYYKFYSTLYDYVQTPNNDNYFALRNILFGNDNTKLEKAFGYSSSIFKCGTKAKPYSHEQFINANKQNPLLSNNINYELYLHFSVSKYLDTAKEYADTTIRMLSATGLFQFSKPLVELLHKNLFKVIFSYSDLKNSIFGVVTQQEFNFQESDFYHEKTITDILNFNNSKVDKILSDLQVSYGISTDIRYALIEENEQKLLQHISEKYPQETVIELLQLFSDRQNDKKIKQYVNEDATVPTIYEYIVAIAWYYISNKKISVYDSLNLTLNGDFEPIIHAGGGAGDIVVKYTDKIVMLEATLMNAAAQKRGEWEPVLRHAINLTTDFYPKKVFTLFIADTLDYNTINIWRAVAAVTLKSSSTSEKAEHVIIMPFTNKSLCYFMEHNISDNKIIAAINKSYDEIKATFDDSWHTKILKELQ